ncbi:MAG: hypothetical protein V3U57_04225 [Robiginitomaculum sp.]
MSALKLESTISLGIIMTLAVQTAGALLWSGAAEARLKALEKSDQSYPAVIERMARIEEQMRMAHQSLSRIEHRLDESE